MKILPGGGVTSALGFKAAGVHAGLRKNKTKSDLALIYSDTVCSAAAVYTKNVVKAAPIMITAQNLRNGHAQAILCNSGNANACAPDDLQNAERMASAAAGALGIAPQHVVVASTGVIGQRLNVEAIESAMPNLVSSLSSEGSEAAANAIMTTDLKKKEYALSEEIGGKTIHIGGIAKGSGMIHPNMGTMLCFITTDCAISPELLQKALSHCTEKTFNRVSVDGDTSTNDMCVVLASGKAGNPRIQNEGEDYVYFLGALHTIMEIFAKEIARDGEGATKLITCTVSGASDEATAELLAKSIIASSLVKTAMFGADANWGRVLCAMGYSGATFNPEETEIVFSSGAGSVAVAKGGRGLLFDEELAKQVLTESEITIEVLAGTGLSSVTAWGCDLSYDYVRINGDYRT